MDFLKTYFTYDQLRCIWWLLIGVLMLGWAITDGFDVGVAMLLKIVGKDDAERQVTDSIFERYSNANGLKNKAISTRIIAKYKPLNAVA